MNTNIRFDLARQARIGLSEAVFCEGKDPAALESLFTRFAAPQLYVNQNLGISQPDTDGDRPVEYRWPSSIKANSADVPVHSSTM